MKLVLSAVLAFAWLNTVAAWQMKQAPLMTQWAAQVDTNAPLPEYPRPQMVRADWLSLNGIWQFQPGATNDPVPVNQTLSGKILVPYPMESAISGVMQYSAFSWYRRTFTVPSAWSGKRIILHFDAVNWRATVYVNGQAGVHKGGYDPFSYDVTSFLNSTTNELIVQVYDPVDAGSQPRGKQTLYPGGIMYTSSSGLWQPVWLEPVDASGVCSLHIVPDLDNSRLRLTANTYASNGITIVATVLTNGTVLNSATGNPQAELDIPIGNPKLWTPDAPFLYDSQAAVVRNGMTVDSVASYFGLRKVSIQRGSGSPRLYLNNQFLFEMGPLDQGFWPDGLYTAPTDNALKSDIQQMKTLGFNLVRKHIKVERARWYYWADKLGILVWQDMPSCNSYTGNPNPPPVDPVQFQTELTNMVVNHWNSPAIIMWDIFNESQGEAGTAGGVGQASTASLVQLVAGLDPARLVNSASGGDNAGVGDVYDAHSYPYPAGLANGTMAPVDGEYGGIGYNVFGHLWNPASSGGNYTGLTIAGPDDIANIYDSYIGMIIGFKATSGLNAAAYTQLTDVETECNGLLTYDRVLKPDPLKIALSNQKAITGASVLATIVPASQTSPQTWLYTTSYTTNTIPANWYATNFDASSWHSGQAGFGNGAPGVTARTSWTTSDIWLRRTFNPGSLTAQQMTSLSFYVYHDEDVQLYLNGVLAGSAASYTTAYVVLPMIPAGQNAIIPNGTNLLAVHCHQTTGGQFIDVGIVRQKLVANTTTVPTDYLNCWKLDETNGNLASDSSGNGNTGSVSGATWTTGGKINGCLSFNGTNNAVQIKNTISNDFSIAFWFKTTQTGRTGPWYQGAGLVDGDIPGNANDFGTALCGNKLAFGTGNPDTTITSTDSINDGAWHDCVATRQLTSGTIQLYLDGNLEATGVGNTNPLNASDHLLMGAIASGGGSFGGWLDEVQIYDRALGNREVTALYVNSVGPSVAPSIVIATGGNGQVTLGWLSSPAANGYNVKRSLVTGGPYSIIATTSLTSYMDTNVVNGATYFYVVSAVNATGDGTNSVQVAVTPSALMAWFEADGISGLTNGAGLTRWPDSSGHGYDATQTASGRAPTYATNAMNGQPVVRFNAANSTYLSFGRPVQDDFAILVVYQSPQGVGTGTDFWNGAGLVNGEVPGSVNDFGTCLNANGQVIAGTGNPDTSLHSGNGFNDGHPHVVTFKRTRSTGAIVLYVDGTQVASGAGGTQSLAAPAQLVLGAQQVLNNYLSGDIAEVKIFNVALADADRSAEESALKCKYGLSGGGPPPPPVGLAGVAGNRQIALSWLPTAGATSYNLFRSGDGVSFTWLTNVLETGVVDASAVSGRTNYYKVTAADACGASAGSAAVGVYLALPQVGMNWSGGLLTISWPEWASDWVLYETTNLVPPVIWSAVTNAVSDSNGQLNVAVPIGSGHQFFRLSSP